MILITGGLGFIGSHVTDALLDLGESCVLVQRRPVPTGDIDDRIVIEQADLADAAAIADIGRRHEITGIVHLAGSGLGDAPIADVRDGIEGLLNVLDRAHEWGVRRIGLASTIGVYDGGGASPLSEAMPLPLSAAHGIPASKKVAEVLASYLGPAVGLEIFTMRIGAVWGPRGRPVSRFFGVPQMVHAAVRGDALDTGHYADSGLDMIYARDCGRAIAMLQTADRLRHRVYNVASGRPTTHRAISAAIERVIPGARLTLLDGYLPAMDHEVYLDISRLTGDTGFTPAYDAEAAVADYVAWLRAGNVR